MKAARLLRWALAVAALAFVVWVVPLRDRCWDPLSPASTRVSISRHPQDGGSCVLHLRTGDVRIGASECARLRCEPGAMSAMLHARIGLLVPLLFVYALGTLAWAARWRALLGFAGITLPLMRVWRVSIEAQAGGVLLPGGIGGDALRIALVVPSRSAQAGGRNARSVIPLALASVVLDRVVGLAVLTGMAAALAFVSGGSRVGALAGGLAVIPVALLAGLVVLRRAPLRHIGWLTEGRIGVVLGPILDCLRSERAPRVLATAAALSVLVAGVQFVIIRGLVFALGGVPTAEKWVYIGTALSFVASALPGLPGAWGTADAAYVYFFGLGGIPSGIALAVCLLYRLFWYLSGIVGAVLHVARPRSSAASGVADPAAEPPA